MFLRGFCALSFVFSSLAFAARRPIFEAKTDDLNVEDRCEVYKPAFFTAEAITYFTIGIKGMKRAGLNEEINVTRGETQILWQALNPKSSAVILRFTKLAIASQQGLVLLLISFNP